jgi:hypothetical protein
VSLCLKGTWGVEFGTDSYVQVFTVCCRLGGGAYCILPIEILKTDFTCDNLLFMFTGCSSVSSAMWTGTASPQGIWYYCLPLGKSTENLCFHLEELECVTC